MSSFLDSTGLSRLVSKITDYFAKKVGTYPNMTVGNVVDDSITAAKVKDNETLPVNISGSAAAVNSSVISTGESNTWWGIKLTNRFTRSAALTIRCLILRNYDDDNVGIVDIVVKGRTDNVYNIFGTLVCRNKDNQYFGKLLYADDTSNTSYIGIQLNFYYSKVIPMIIGDTESDKTSANRSIVVEFGNYFNNVSALTKYNAEMRRLVYTNDLENRGNPNIPVYVKSDGSVAVCTQVASCEAINRDFTLPALNDVSKCVYFVTNVNSTSITASYGGSVIGTVPAQSMTAFQWYNSAWHKHSLA